jgi:adenine deaminase
LAQLPLPIGGLISDRDDSWVCLQEKQLHDALIKVVRSNKFKNAFEVMSFLSLPVIPKVRITTKGIYKVK